MKLKYAFIAVCALLIFCGCKDKKNSIEYMGSCVNDSDCVLVGKNGCLNSINRKHAEAYSKMLENQYDASLFCARPPGTPVPFCENGKCGWKLSERDNEWF